MSDKVTKMPVSQESSETKSMTVAIDMSYHGDTGVWDTGTVYMVVTGIPVDLFLKPEKLNIEEYSLPLRKTRSCILRHRDT